MASKKSARPDSSSSHTPASAAGESPAPGKTSAQSVDSEVGDAESARGLPFPVVGIGASAGGLEAASAMLHALPVDTGMAFVLIQHLSPSRSSLLSEILGRATRLPVLTVEDGLPVEPDHVYVIPPDTGMELSEGRLRLSPRKKADGTYHPIDQFLRSLAAAQGHRAIAVILSGTANDGTIGCEEIKAEGGITFAQNETAQQDSMPRSAIAAGCVDFVLAPQEIAREIARISRHPLVQRHTAASSELSRDALEGVMESIRSSTGVDFTHYKHNTLLRRIGRRMVLHKVDNLKDYQRLIEVNPAEQAALFNDILISVTSFFRNPEAFEVLKEKIFPEITRDRSRHLPVRIWVLGCSTGEEAYSIAIAFSEYASMVERAIPVQIFASDLNGTIVEKARAGIYPKAIEQDVSPARRQRFFVEHDGDYRITKSIRDMIVFARHNALTDPPFSHMDLISCRNLLIYLDPVLQHRLLPLLHYGLQPDGFLWLGASESTGAHRNLFEVVDAKHKFYQRRHLRAQHGGLIRKADTSHEPAARQPAGEPFHQAVTAGVDPQREADRLLLSRYAPAGVLVNEDFDILQFRGDTGPYLSPSPGRASLSLLKMLRDGLVIAVRAALLKAKREGRAVRHDVMARSDGAERKVSLEVIPIKANSEREACFLVVFDDDASARARARPSPKAGGAGKVRGDKAATEIARLEAELTASREYLQSVIEQQEAANEELQSANEEVQSANEELQSINEELETSKEEIQSSSEELATVNDELNSRNQELTRSHNDISNLIASVQLAIVMVGPDLRIRRFTPAAEKLLNLIGSDIGRPVGDLTTNIDLPHLDTLLLEVMESVTAREQLTRDRKGRWFSLRLRPYRTLDNKIDGVVMTLVDVDALKKAEEVIRASEKRLAILRDYAPLGIRENDAEGRYIQVNERYCAITGYTREELLGRRFVELVVPEDRPRAMELWRQLVHGDTQSYRDERRYLHKSGREIWVEVTGYTVRGEDERLITGVAFIQDISERRQADAALRAADRHKNEFIAMLAHELRNPLAPLLNVAELLTLPEAGGGRTEELRGVLERQIRNLSRMTDDLLDVSRVSQGKMRLHRDVVDLKTVAQRAIELFRPSIESRGQTLAVELPKHPIVLDADPVRLEQVIDNLLTNASKYTDAGGTISLTVTARSGTPPGGHPERRMAEIRVRDSGRGIPPELLPHIFEPFTQGDHSLDRSRGGLGIGLTLVKNLVDLHGGSVEALSGGPGQGAEFVVRLPLSAESLPTTAEAPERIRGRSRKVLVVDDNPDGAETLAMLLKATGYEVRIAVDGDEALESTLAFQPDVVLLDIGLPGMDGFEVAQALRSRPESRPVTIVAISGYGQEEDRRKAGEAGIDHYFTKPIDIDMLLQLLAEGPPPRGPRPVIPVTDN